MVDYTVKNPLLRAYAYILRTARNEEVFGQTFIDEDSRLALAVLYAARQEQQEAGR
jgi:hypothetical protein